MSRRTAIVTEREVKRILKGASDAGITMGILATRKSILFVPVDMIETTSPASALAKWKAERDESKSRGNS